MGETRLGRRRGRAAVCRNKVNAAALNSWLFNKDTVDKVLQHLMEHGHKAEGGDRLAKTIHLRPQPRRTRQFIEERFNHHYPQHKPGTSRASLTTMRRIRRVSSTHFSQKDKAPHIAISVDMLDTGIDVPEVANLVFFKPVYSRIKFWQMIGRGTRLCPNLFGPEDDKHDFRVFDFCFNFDFFRENPEGIEVSGGVSLSRPALSVAGAVADPRPGDAGPGTSRSRGALATTWALTTDRELYREVRGRR